MKDKLIEIITNEMYKIGFSMEQELDDELCNAFKFFAVKIADSLIENGIIIPPCKVGDTFYGIIHDRYFKYEVRAIVINRNGIWLETTYEMRFIYGKDAFLTEEEAQAKINGW